MKPWVRWIVLGAAAIGLVILFVALQPDGEGGASPTPSTSSPTDEPSQTGSAPPTPSPTPEAQEVEVTVSGDEVEGPERPTVQLGETVLLVVRADVSDEVHVHGYDLMADVAPGQPARIRFEANIAGVFEVELEDAGRPLLELEVTP